MKNTTIRRLLGGLAVLVLGSSLASASTITWYNNIFAPGSGAASNSNPGTPTAFNTLTGWTATVDIPKFDSNLGPLNGVTVVLNWIQNGQLVVFNNSASPASFTAGHIGANLSVTDTFTTVNAGATAGNVADTLGAFSAGTYPGLSGSGSATGFASSFFFVNYENPGGVGSVTFSFSSSAGNASTTGCPSCLSGGNPSNTGAQLVVTYTYGVPEPGTFMILGTGLAGIGLVMRKRSKKA